jgi:hypothetical protein
LIAPVVAAPLLLALLLAEERASAGATPAGARAAAARVLEALAPAAVVLFDEPAPPRATGLLLGAKVGAPVAALQALLRDPARYQKAVPWFVRADPVTAPKSPAPSGPRRLAWELEVPLWNLEGELSLTPTAEGAEVRFLSGDLAPGVYRLSAVAAPGGSALWIDARANIRNLNFMTRRLAARDPRAEPAMTATAAWVLLRALTLEAEGRTGTAARWPKGARGAPDPERLDGRPLAALVAEAGVRLPLATVQVRPDGRLHGVTLAVATDANPSRLQAHLATPGAWRALPGWRSVDVRGSGQELRWEVDSTMPFVDFDAIWAVAPGPPLRARAVADDWTGAALRWDVAPAPGGRAVAALSLHGRVENTGYLPRRLMDAEPLLEHGLSLGLAYVVVLALVRALPAK